jgi:hypothetical protein
MKHVHRKTQTGGNFFWFQTGCIQTSRNGRLATSTKCVAGTPEQFKEGSNIEIEHPAEAYAKLDRPGLLLNLIDHS